MDTEGGGGGGGEREERRVRVDCILVRWNCWRWFTIVDWRGGGGFLGRVFMYVVTSWRDLDNVWVAILMDLLLLLLLLLGGVGGREVEVFEVA